MTDNVLNSLLEYLGMIANISRDQYRHEEIDTVVDFAEWSIPRAEEELDPSFFRISVHRAIHLAQQLRRSGPLRVRRNLFLFSISREWDTFWIHVLRRIMSWLGLIFQGIWQFGPERKIFELRSNIHRVRDPIHNSGVNDIMEKQTLRSFAAHLVMSGLVTSVPDSLSDANTKEFIKAHTPHKYYLDPPGPTSTAKDYPRFQFSFSVCAFFCYAKTTTRVWWLRIEIMILWRMKLVDAIVYGCF
jgi:hypothetical protein